MWLSLKECSQEEPFAWSGAYEQLKVMKEHETYIVSSQSKSIDIFHMMEPSLKLHNIIWIACDEKVIMYGGAGVLTWCLLMLMERTAVISTPCRMVSMYIKFYFAWCFTLMATDSQTMSMKFKHCDVIWIVME